MAGVLRVRTGRERGGRDALLSETWWHSDNRNLELPVDAVSLETVMGNDLTTYFRSFGLDATFAAQLATDIRQSAQAEGVPAMALAERRVEAWFARLTGIEGVSAVELGRAAFLLAGAPARWPGSFLANEVPGGLVEAVRSALPVATPAMAPAVMPDQPLVPQAALVSLVRFFVPGVDSNAGTPESQS